MENRKFKQSKVITNYSTQWQMEGSKGKAPQPGKISHASDCTFIQKGEQPSVPPKASPFSSCKHLV